MLLARSSHVDPLKHQPAHFLKFLELSDFTNGWIFGELQGLSEEEIAEVLKISPRTVRRDWYFAKSWLTRELSR
jgi:hypothetical protein